MYKTKFTGIGFVILWAVAISGVALTPAEPVVAVSEFSGGGDVCSSPEPVAQESDEAPALSIATVTALAALYVATDGDNWTDNANWMSDHPMDQWYGVTTNAEGRVTGLALGDNGLTGSIPRHLANISTLQHLDLSCNSLSGAIPVGLTSLPYLRSLDLSSNQLSGKLPGLIFTGGGGNLERIDLSENLLTGRIPDTWGEFVSLEHLDLSVNSLWGGVPSELDLLTSLKVLDVSFNNLTCAIPKQLGNLTSLQRLNLSFNDLSGQIPAELHSLENLEALNLSVNRLTGGIPPEFSSLAKLKTMTAWGNNSLGGCVPSELRNQGLNIDWSMRYCAAAPQPTPKSTSEPTNAPPPSRGSEVRMIVAPGADVALRSPMPLSHSKPETGSKFKWSYLSGPEISLMESNSERTWLTAPLVDEETESLSQSRWSSLACRQDRCLSWR